MTEKKLLLNHLIQGRMLVNYSETVSAELISLDENIESSGKAFDIDGFLLRVENKHGEGDPVIETNRVIIGFGSSKTGVGIMSDNFYLFGKKLTLENFEECKLVFDSSLEV